MSQVIKNCTEHGPLTEDKIRREKNGQYIKIQCIACKQENDILRKRKISKIDYLTFQKNQDNKCAICDKEETHLGRSGHPVPLAVDHCHKCDGIRGLLCQSCNTAIGKCGEDIAILQSAISYLTEFK